ncbi:MAG: type II toxin-antitoxin system VapC family toxin [Ignavibacteriaceae bacterium]|nr:type II toxin-antitoxin system VapC family toxin [Ignavibacteriaceae bacterium]
MSFLADSNIIIYAITGKHNAAIEFISETFPSVSVITKMEVLGYHNLDRTQFDEFLNFFEIINVIPLTNPIVNKTIKIRKYRKIKLADAIIPATAIVSNLTPVTANLEDFKNIPGLSVLNIFAT